VVVAAAPADVHAAGLRDVRSRLLVIAVVAVGTYVGLYALTTWLGTFA